MKMASFFGGNPFSTPVGQKIEQATDASLSSENWALNMEICDIINETEDGAKDAMKAIRKRLNQNASRNFIVVMYTLIVLETCVKNCGRKFHILVCNKEFISELVKLIGPKNGPPTVIQDKVLFLVRSWAEAFRNEPELTGALQVYNELKQKGIEFPAEDVDEMVPIHTPQRTLHEEVPMPVSSEPVNTDPIITLSSDQLGKLSSELQVVEGNLTVLSEMLSELVPGQELPDELKLLRELYSTCKAMQERLVELINQLSNNEITAELLRINDGLNNLFLRYKRYEKNRRSVSKVTNKDNEATLIDLTDSPISRQLAELDLNTLPNERNPNSSLITENNKDDEFDMFAQSRNIISESSKAGESSYDVSKEDNIISGNLAEGTVQPKGQVNMHSERDFDEMAAWLGEKQEESLTSSEFEKFLAERAAAAETLPTATESNSSRGRMKKEEDSMFAL